MSTPHAPGPHPAGSPDGGDRPVPARGPTHANPNVGYRLEDFLDDQLRLLAVGTGRGTEHPDTIERPDRRSRRVYTAELREALGRAGAGQPFREKYGRESGEGHRRRFELVLDFIESCRETMVWSGLADAEDRSVTVREELLGWLLEKRLDPDQPRIEPWLLRRFLDEWSHRRM